MAGTPISNTLSNTIAGMAPKAPANPFASAPATTIQSSAPVSGLVSLPSSSPSSPSYASMLAADQAAVKNGSLPSNPYITSSAAPTTTNSLFQPSGSVNNAQQFNQGANAQVNTPSGTAATNGAVTQNSSSSDPYSQGVSGLINLAGSTPPATTAYEQAVTAAQPQIQSLRSQSAEAEGSYLTGGIPASIAQGRAAGVAGVESAEEGAINAGLAQLQGGSQAAQSQQQLAQQGFQQAGALTQPQLNAPGQQYYQPSQAGTGSSTSGSGITPDVMNSYAQMAANGELSQVPSSITSNPVLNNQLNTLAKSINPNYNPVLSAASATTQQQGQQLQTQTGAANAALDTLATSFNSLPGVETGGIPLTNGIAQWIGSELGSGALSQFKANLADARAQLVGALNAAGGTPTGNEATALQYLPDNMTPAQFQQNVGTAQQPGIVRQLLQQKVQQFTTSGTAEGSGQVSPSTGSATNGAVNYNF